MALPLEQFVRRLEDSGVIASDTLHNFLPPKASPRDAEDLARELIRQQKLTKFQAEQVWQGNGRALVLGNYLLLDKIGQGGMGAVYRAVHRRMQRTVAIKMLPPALMKNAPAAARFQREVVAAAKLIHPNIVAAFDADEANGIHFLVMEYVEGIDLSAYVKKNGPFPVPQAVHYILQTAKGLEFAHGKGVIHRDIKPANLLLGKDGVVKILDMGLARIEGGTAGQDELTGSCAVMGTVDYMAPEQAMSTKHADARADIYSLGCTLFYLLTGKATFDGESLMAKLVAHRECPAPSLRSLRPDVPEQLESIFQRMVAKKVEERYQTMTEVIGDLQNCGRQEPVNIQPALSVSETGLTNFLKELPEVSAASRSRTQAAAAGRESRNRNRLLIGCAVLGTAILLAGFLFRRNATQGTLIVEVNEPGAEVQVLTEDGKVELTENSGKETLSISVDPGKHRLNVVKQGFTAYDKKFEIEANTKRTIAVKLSPLKGQAATAATQKPLLGFEHSEFDAWVKKVAGLPPEQQVEAVSRKFVELNPEFDGKFGEDHQRIRDGVVWRLQFSSDNVTDLSPLRALPGLEDLTCDGASLRSGKLRDLSPLKGVALTRLSCNSTAVSDLSALKGLPLISLSCGYTPVSNLAPLAGMKLTYLFIRETNVSDLSPLRDMPLSEMDFSATKVTELAPLAGMKLQHLWCYGIPVADLSPLQGMPLKELNLGGTQVSDLSPLKGMPLVQLNIGFSQVAELTSLRGLPLTHLHCSGLASLSDLTPLQGMPLMALEIGRTKIADLSPLAGMPLLELSCSETPVQDLSPLKGLGLTTLHCSDTQVSDLTPLAGMNLKTILFTPKNIAHGIEVLRQMTSLTELQVGLSPTDRFPAARFWEKYDAGDFGKPL